MRSVLITGCSSGIGLCLALGLKDAGFRVFASARNAQDVLKLAELGFEAVQLDLASSDSIRCAVADIFQKTDTLYGLIHNGGYGQVGALADIARADLVAQFQTNVFGWHELTTLVLPRMKAQNCGRIIYLSSVLGIVAMPLRGAYNASKFATEGLVDTLRLELVGTNIQLSLIQPGPIVSQFRQNAYRIFQKTVAVADSDYQPHYAKMVQRLNSDKPVAYTLPAEAVLKCARHALQARRAKIHYRVTVPTHVLAVLKRILPSRIMDKILLKASGGGAK